MSSVLDGGWREVDSTQALEDLVEIRRHWRLHFMLGVLLGALGGAALTFAFTPPLGSTAVFGWLLVGSGLFQAILAFQVPSWNGFSLHVLGSVLEIIVGALMIRAPADAALLVTLLVAVYLLVGGLFRVITGLSVGIPRAGWTAFGGLVSFLLGLAVWQQWPASGLWFIGACVGIDLIFHGAAWVVLALDVHRLRNPVSLQARR